MSKSQSHKNDKKNNKQSQSHLKGKAAHKIPVSEKISDSDAVKEVGVVPGNLAMKETKGAKAPLPLG
ncbi:MAG: hypothetical protein G8345_19950 [Magnetococcales bacterium]|nr:hypothetical protein [Magnetococcales bacterium]NGZ29145.1 hypothetical protein [Magnetococcales bacterium]